MRTGMRSARMRFAIAMHAHMVHCDVSETKLMCDWLNISIDREATRRRCSCIAF